MLRRRRPITTEEIAAAWSASREARIAIRSLVGEEQEGAATAFARVVEPLRLAYEDTGNPAFALLAIQVLRPPAVSVRRPGHDLQYAHCPRWVIEALARAVEEADASLVEAARRRWVAMEVSVRDHLHKEVGDLSDRERHRLLQAWFGSHEP